MILLLGSQAKISYARWHGRLRPWNVLAVGALVMATVSCSDATSPTVNEALPATPSLATSTAPTSSIPSTSLTPTTSATPSVSVAPTSAVDSTSPPASGPEPKECGEIDYEFPDALYPFTDRCIDLGFGDYHYFDESPAGTPKGVALMVHGNPASSFLYRNVATNLLARGYRVVAMDHYGFGESAHPTSAEFGYKPSDHSRVLIDFVDALNIEDATLVVQDWGGPIGLSMAVKRPERIKSILIMNTWAWQVGDADASGPYGSLTRWSQLNKSMGDELVANGLIVSGAAGGLAAPYEEPMATEVKNAYLGPFFDPATGNLRSPTIAAPTSVFARSIIDDTETFSSLGELSPIADKPVYFYFGGQDPIFGALTPNPDGTCAAGTSSQGDGPIYCDDPAGEHIYPYIDHFKSLWNPIMVKGTEINSSASHFVQENAPDRISDIVVTLNS
jgi:haloalkane dehalogenase